MTLSFRRKPSEDEVRKRGRELVRAIERMSDAADLQVSTWARPSTAEMINAAERFGKLFPPGAAERQATSRMAAAGREMLAALGVDQARLEAAAVDLRAGVLELNGTAR
ncbi:MAG: hypothetical protein ACYDAL_02040 [Candidatus Dormibacteraceae bacterium]